MRGCLLFVLICLPSFLFGWELDSFGGGVEIYITSTEGGVDLFASNRNEHVVYLVVELSYGENVVNGLPMDPIRLSPFDQLYLGGIVQDNPHRDWDYTYRWGLSVAESRISESYYWYWY